MRKRERRERFGKGKLGESGRGHDPNAFGSERKSNRLFWGQWELNHWE